MYDLSTPSSSTMAALRGASVLKPSIMAASASNTRPSRAPHRPVLTSTSFPTSGTTTVTPSTSATTPAASSTDLPTTASSPSDLSLTTTLGHLVRFLVEPLVHLYPSDKIDALKSALVEHLTPKLAPSWDERNPSAGSGIRSLIALPGKYPTPLVQAAQQVGGIDIPQWASLISKTGEWELWVDPGSVVLRDGDWLWIDEGFESGGVSHSLGGMMGGGGGGGARYGQTLHTVWQAPLAPPTPQQKPAAVSTTSASNNNNSSSSSSSSYWPEPIRAPAVFRIPAAPLMPPVDQFSALSLFGSSNGSSGDGLLPAADILATSSFKPLSTSTLRASTGHASPFQPRHSVSPPSSISGDSDTFCSEAHTSSTTISEGFGGGEKSSSRSNTNVEAASAATAAVMATPSALAMLDGEIVASSSQIRRQGSAHDFGSIGSGARTPRTSGASSMSDSKSSLAQGGAVSGSSSTMSLADKIKAAEQQDAAGKFSSPAPAPKLAPATAAVTTPGQPAGSGAVRGRAATPGSSSAVQPYDGGNVGVLGGGVKLGGSSSSSSNNNNNNNSSNSITTASALSHNRTRSHSSGLVPDARATPGTPAASSQVTTDDSRSTATLTGGANATSRRRRARARNWNGGAPKSSHTLHAGIGGHLSPTPGADGGWAPGVVVGHSPIVSPVLPPMMPLQPAAPSTLYQHNVWPVASMQSPPQMGSPGGPPIPQVYTAGLPVGLGCGVAGQPGNMMHMAKAAAAGGGGGYPPHFYPHPMAHHHHHMSPPLPPHVGIGMMSPPAQSQPPKRM